MAFACWYDIAASRIGAGLGFPLDDAWIHAQFARNLATGHGFSYTGPDWVSGSTAPAWTVMLALGYAIVPSILLAAKALGLLLQIATAVAAGILLADLLRSTSSAVVGSVLIACTPVIVWGAVSGMEVPLVAFLVVSGLALHVRVRTRLGAFSSAAGVLVLVAASLARPEAVVIAPLAAADLLLLHAGRRAVQRAMVILCGAVVLLGPLVLFSYMSIGRPLPSTFYVKSGPGVVRALAEHDPEMLRRDLAAYGPRAVRQFGDILIDQFSWGAWLVPFGAIACFTGGLRRRGAWLLPVILLAVPYAMGVTSPQRLKPDNVRYAGQLVVVAAVLMLIALDAARRVVGRAAWVAAAAVLILVGVRAADGSRSYALSVKNIQELHVRLGLWAADHLPQGVVIAANDVGALAFFSGHRILDLEGLVSPVALGYRQYRDRGLRVVESEHPDFIAIFPAWYPEIAQRTDLFHEEYRVAISDNYISAGDTLIVYSTPWTRANVIRTPAIRHRGRKLPV